MEGLREMVTRRRIHCYLVGICGKFKGQIFDVEEYKWDRNLEDRTKSRRQTKRASTMLRDMELRIDMIKLPQ